MRHPHRTNAVHMNASKSSQTGAPERNPETAPNSNAPGVQTAEEKAGPLVRKQRLSSLKHRLSLRQSAAALRAKFNPGWNWAALESEEAWVEKPSGAGGGWAHPLPKEERLASFRTVNSM